MDTNPLTRTGLAAAAALALALLEPSPALAQEPRRTDEVEAAATPTATATAKAKAKELEVLLERLHQPDPKIKREVRARLLRYGPGVVPQLLVAARAEQDPRHSAAIIRLVGELEVGADAAVPGLILWIEDERRPQPQLEKLISGYRDRPAQAAAIALGALAPYATTARDEIRKALQNELQHRYGFHIEPIRIAYFRSMVNANGEIGDLIAQLEDGVPYVREVAAEALGRRGAAALIALDALLVAMTGKHPQKIKVGFGGGWSGNTSAQWDDKVQAAAARAMVRIAPADKRSRAAHLTVVDQDDDPDLLVVALRHVGFLGAAAEPALPRLCRLVETGEVRLAAEAVTAIGMIGILDDQVSQTLTRATGHHEKAVAERAAATLRMLTPRQQR